MDLPKKTTSKGQAVLVVLLGMAVTLTIVLSIVSRSITDISLSTTDEDSARAFSAAEAGIENLIISGSAGIGATLNDGASYSAIPTDYAQGSSTVNYDDIDKFYAGEDVTVWFVGHDSDNKMTCSEGDCYVGNMFRVGFGNPGTDPNSQSAPAIEISVYYDETRNAVNTHSYSGVKVARVNFDPGGASRTEANKFRSTIAGTDFSLGEKIYAFSTGDINFETDLGIPSGCSSVQGCLLFARVKFLYNDSVSQALGFGVGSGTLPAQGKLYSSNGTYQKSTRGVQVVDLYKSPLGIFESGVFSAGSNADLVK